MRGNCRTSGTLRKEEGGNVFGLGSRTPIALTLLVKKPTTEQQKAKIYYHEIGSFLAREQKLAELKRLGSVLNGQLQLSSITPSKDHDWINKKDDLFQTFIPLGDKKNEEVKTIFVPFYSRGVGTSRDAWVYNFSRSGLENNVSSMIDFYNNNVDQLANIRKTNPDYSYNEIINLDPKKISWTRGLKHDYSLLKKHEYQQLNIRLAVYRPFIKQNMYFDRYFNDMVCLFPRLFPTPQTKNLIICVSGLGGPKQHSVLISNEIVDLNCLDSGTQCFPLYYYEKEYRTRFAADLKKSLPRIFFPATYEEFNKYREAGRHLAKLHLNYESGPLCSSVVVSGCEHGNFKVDKMRFLAKDDKRTIIFNNDITIDNIPQEAYNYVINGKSAIEWIMERYAVTIDKNSKIVNDPNQWSEDPRYVLDLLLRIIQMSLETLKIVNKLPKLNLPS